MKNLSNHVIATVAVCSLALSGAAYAAEAGKLEDMPIREVTVFKDGHAFVLHEGVMPVDENGDIVLDYLPRPIIGTFWVYSRDEGLQSVVSGSKIVTLSMTAITRDELLKANIGKRVRIRESSSPAPYEATILAIPSRSSDELAAIGAPDAPPQLPVTGSTLMLKVAEGTKVIQQEAIIDITFLDEPESRVEKQEFRNVMTMRFGRGFEKREVSVGMTYVQRGIRWIPSYRIEIDGKGKAKLKLQATIINELKDLSDVKTHLVIGVPSFAFKETVDPMSMQETVAQLGAVFREDSRSRYAFSNAIMTQSARMSEYRGYDAAGPSGSGDAIDLGPEIKGAGANENLFVFTIDHISLKKGQRMVIPVAEYELSYKNVYTLDLPFSPPVQIAQNLNSEQQLELARLMSTPKVKHVIRMKNDSTQPITTAPALVLSKGTVIAQGMTKYTAIGADCDLELTVAVDISARRSDVETGRTPKAITVNGHEFEKVAFAGTIFVTNNKKEPIDIEVTRGVVGIVTSATADGVISQLGPQDWGEAAGNLPDWWRWYNWQWWWYHVNSLGQIKWKATIDPGQKAEFGYEWHYFWRY